MNKRDPYRFFRIEARELLDQMTAALRDVQGQASDNQAVAAVLRHAHTFKGAAAVVGLKQAADLAHDLEELLGPCRQRAVPEQTLTQARRLLRSLEQILESLGAASQPTQQEPPADSSASSGQQPPNPSGHPSRERSDAVQSSSPEVTRGSYTPEVTRASSAPKWSSRAPEVRPESTTPNVSPRTPQGSPDEAASREESRSKKSPTKPAEHGAIVCEVEQLDTLLAAASDADIAAEGIAQVVPELARITRQVKALARDQPALAELATHLDATRTHLSLAVENTTMQVQAMYQRVRELRFVRADTIFGNLERAVYDAADRCGRKARFVGNGGEQALDGAVLQTLKPALLHIVRNAVAHGIESPHQRRRAGKPAIGEVRVDVQRKGTRVVFACRDDGRGIDLDAVHQAAIQRGLVTSEAPLSDAERARLIFHPGLTTRATAGAVAGRGVGLEVVEAVAHKLRGTVDVTTQTGKETTISLKVPVSAASWTVLHVQLSSQTVAIPLEAIEKAWVAQERPLVEEEGRTMMVLDGQTYPYSHLAAVLDLDVDMPTVCPVLQLRGGVLLGVDRVGEAAQRVLLPLPRPSPLIVGAFLDQFGVPQLVVHPEAVVEAVQGGGVSGRTPAPKRRQPILVVDDSMTTRMMLESVLTTHGFAVEMAVSAEDGWGKLQEQTFGAVVSDVEMPGMDGFEFVGRVRADPRFTTLPTVLVTTLATDDHKRRGLAVGADAFFVKTQFNELEFIRTLQMLLAQ